jgi:GNAT superfamily N-acetyltransferase
VSVHLDALADDTFAAAAAQARTVCTVTRLPFGEVRRSDAYPDLVFLNGISDLCAPRWTVSDLEGAIARYLGGVAHVRVASRDPETIAGLGGRLAEADYESECRVAMVQVAPPAAPPTWNGAVRLVETPADWQAFEGLIREDTAEHDWSSVMTEQLIRLYRPGEEQPPRWLLAHAAGEAVAYVGLYQHGTVGYLYALYTRPSARRRGTGSTLVYQAGRRARALGCERLTLQCTRDSFLPAYYEALGFRTVGEMWIWTRRASR